MHCIYSTKAYRVQQMIEDHQQAFHSTPDLFDIYLNHNRILV